MNSIAIILPAYNEELTIKETILSFYNELPNANIVVVDNNSNDKTSEIVQNTFKKFDIKGKLLFEARQGKGNAIRYAFQKIEADIYIMSDADMTYPASEIYKLIEPIINEDVDMVVGDRISRGDYARENKRPLHTFGNQLVKKLVNKLFNANISDIMSGYRAFSKKFVKNYPILVEGFELETNMTLHALDKRFKIKEVSIDYKDRPEGSFSKLNTINDGAKVLFTIFQIFRYYKPLLFFSILSVLFALLSLLSAIPVFNDWILYKYIYHVPLAILATGLGLISIILFSAGIILDAIVYQNKLEFEQRLL
ncbi:glycosyltransferase [Arcobacter sp. LA11]|uniref:glycosyltransferase n=1 Tax=Arcobacter sp. LA11 TaxID=1898176 RepID=UPI0009340F2C|nr:glycosyltransferase [Arcobacter sp. LA11]